MKDEFGKGALHIAIEQGSKRMVECLIRNSVNVNILDGHGNNGLLLALKKGNIPLTFYIYVR